MKLDRQELKDLKVTKVSKENQEKKDLLDPKVDQEHLARLEHPERRVNGVKLDSLVLLELMDPWGPEGYPEHQVRLDHQERTVTRERQVLRERKDSRV